MIDGGAHLFSVLEIFMAVLLPYKYGKDNNL